MVLILFYYRLKKRVENIFASQIDLCNIFINLLISKLSSDGKTLKNKSQPFKSVSLFCMKNV